MLRAGDWVEVRGKEEILKSLDKNGRLQELPFMPQMFQYCGERFRVFKRAHKTCDTINEYAGRRVADAVHLNLRCDGKAFGGCQAACLIFWKEAWLRPVEGAGQPKSSLPQSDSLGSNANSNEGGCSEEDVLRATSGEKDGGEGTPRYYCQATQVTEFTKPLASWDVRQYFEDYTSGNVTLGQIICGFIYVSYYHLTLAKRGRLGIPARWVYDQFQALVGGVPYPRRRGVIPLDQPTPTVSLNLQPGELVRVKSYKDIQATLDRAPKNRGMFFDAELVPFCGGVYRVKARVERFINERTGLMTTLKTPALILDGVWCQARYSNRRMFCPRSIYSWWREIWLERVSENEVQVPSTSE